MPASTARGDGEDSSAVTTTAELDPEACYRASIGRDARWDGRFYLGVVTTGIYCRPSCPARKPLRRNCRFFAAAAAAVAAGFRACRRCRPDALPGSRQWDSRGDLAARAVRMVRDGVVDEVGVAGLAARLAVSERHLARVLVAEVGATAQQLGRTRRAQTARMLIDQTALPLADVAFAAGFASVRQFNDVVREEFAATPSQLRAARRGPDRSARNPGADVGPEGCEGPSLVLRLRHRPPLAATSLARFLAGRVVPGLETHDAVSGEHTRAVPAPSGPAVVTVVLPDPGEGGEEQDHVVVRVRVADVADVAPVVARVRRWLDLDADPLLVDEALGADPLLGPLVRRRPGLRVPGTVDGVETAVMAVLGQQVSLRAARTSAGRLVAAYGTPAPGGLTGFPTAGALAAAGPDALREVTGVTGAQARTLHALASAAAGGLALGPDADRDATRAALLALPGVGPWTSEYVALRALGDPDAFLAGDLVVRRVLGGPARAAEERARAWRPWRGYALMHLWTEEALA